MDPFRSYEVTDLKGRGPRVTLELLEVLEARAEARGESFSQACARLPEVWRATMLVAFVVERFAAGDVVADLLDALGPDASALVIDALTEIGEADVASALAGGDEDVDEPGPRPPAAAVLARVRKKVGVLIAGMTAPFPGADPVSRSSGSA